MLKRLFFLLFVINFLLWKFVIFLQIRQWRRSVVFIVNFVHISHLALVFFFINFEEVNANWDVFCYYPEAKSLHKISDKNNGVNYSLYTVLVVFWTSAERFMYIQLTSLHKKWSFPLRISSVNVPNPQFPVDLVTFTGEILTGKLHFLWSDWCISRFNNKQK